VVGGSVVGGAVVGAAVVGAAVVGGSVVGGAVVGGAVVGDGVTPGGAGTPATGSGPVGGVGSSSVMGLIDWISPPTPETSGNPPPVGVGGSDEAADDPGGWLLPPPPPPDVPAGREVSGVRVSVAPAMAPPKLVQPGVQGPWSLRLNTSSRPISATTVAAQARARRRSDGRQLTRYEGPRRRAAAACSAAAWRDQAPMMEASNGCSSAAGVASSFDSSVALNGRCRNWRAPSGGRSGRRSPLSSSMTRGPS
jgi:hypothetical protein